VEGNRISDTRFGILASGPTTIQKAKISGNSVTGAIIGVYLFDGANGYRVTDNKFPGGSSFADILLDEAFPAFGEVATHDNKVVVTETTTVLDLGLNNTVVVKNSSKQ